MVGRGVRGHRRGWHPITSATLDLRPRSRARAGSRSGTLLLGLVAAVAITVVEIRRGIADG